MDRDRPPKEDAKKRRLKALEEFSHLGAGFAIALKDLEIRGAGNLLGPAAVGPHRRRSATRCTASSCRPRSSRRGIRARRRPDAVPRRAGGRRGPRRAASVPPRRLRRPIPRSVSNCSARLDGAVDARRARRRNREQSLRRPLRQAAQAGRQPARACSYSSTCSCEHGVLARCSASTPDRIVVISHPARPARSAAPGSTGFEDVRAVEAGKTHLILPAVPRPQDGRRERPGTGPRVSAFLLDALTRRRCARTELTSDGGMRGHNLSPRSVRDENQGMRTFGRARVLAAARQRRLPLYGCRCGPPESRGTPGGTADRGRGQPRRTRGRKPFDAVVAIIGRSGSSRCARRTRTAQVERVGNRDAATVGRSSATKAMSRQHRPA